MYTNAGQFWRKFPEFTVQINNEQWMLIGITEVKPKKSMKKLFPAEFSIDHIREYDSPFHTNIATNIGQGILLYAHKSLGAKEVEMKTDFQESVFVEISLNNRDKLLVRCIYRSDNGTEEKNNNLRSLIREAASKTCSHILLMGDFNHSNIDWDNWTTKVRNLNSQSVYKITIYVSISKSLQRVRGNDTPNLLDLIFTNEKNMINNIEYQSPLGKSDHSVMTFKFNCYTILKKLCKDKAILQQSGF